MQAEYDFNDNEIDENHRGNSRLHPPLIVSRFHGTQQPWKRSYTVSSGKDNEHKNNRHLSTGGGVALIFALAGKLYSFYIPTSFFAASQKLIITQSGLHSLS